MLKAPERYFQGSKSLLDEVMFSLDWYPKERSQSYCFKKVKYSGNWRQILPQERV